MDVKILAGVGIAALAVTSGNQARRHQRQNAKNKAAPKGPRQKDMRRTRPPLAQTQDSSMYHNDVAELAAGISSYRYGAQLPGYMT